MHKHYCNIHILTRRGQIGYYLYYDCIWTATLSKEVINHLTSSLRVEISTGRRLQHFLMIIIIATVKGYGYMHNLSTIVSPNGIDH